MSVLARILQCFWHEAKVREKVNSSLPSLDKQIWNFSCLSKSELAVIFCLVSRQHSWALGEVRMKNNLPGRIIYTYFFPTTGLGFFPSPVNPLSSGASEIEGYSLCFSLVEWDCVICFLFCLSEYYPGCEVLFMNLANIHAIRKSFHSLRTLCSGPRDAPK